MAVTVAWHSTYPRWRRQQILAAKHSLNYKANFFYCYILPIPVAAFLIAWLAFLYSRDPLQVTSSLVFWTGGVTVYTIWVWLARDRRLKRAFALSQPEIQCSTTLSEEKIESAQLGVLKVEVEWSALTEAVYDKDIILLFLIETQNLCVPLAEMNEEQRLELDTLIRAKVKKITYAN